MDYDEFSTSPKPGRAVPIWIIVVGCVTLLGIACVVVLAAYFFFFITDSETAESDSPFFSSGNDSRSEDDQESRSGPDTTGSSAARYRESFDDLGNWDVGEVVSEADPNFVEAVGDVEDGVYDFTVNVDNTFFWTNGNESFGDGTYEVEATAVSGGTDAGYGMIFMHDERPDNFYLLEVSVDGYIWIGYCEDGCTSAEPLVEDGWFMDAAVNDGLEASNVLRVDVEDGRLTFYVNGTEIDRVTDNRLRRGDIGLAIETFDEGSHVVFDNFTYTPPE
jgi:hypothetical protein